MFVKYLTADGYGLSQPIAIAATEVIDDYINQLDGHTKTLLSISDTESFEENTLTIGGSSSSGLVVYAIFEDGIFHQLLNEVPAGSSEIEVVAGGQPGDYPAEYVVSSYQAREAAAYFAQHGRLAPSAIWLDE